MNLSRFRIWSVVSVLMLSGLLIDAHYAQDYSKVKVKTIPVKGGIYMLAGAGGNIGVSAGEDGVFLIDDEFAPLTEKIRMAIARISDQPIKFLLNTHWHGDHTGGNENLGRGGVLIIAHDNVRKRLSVGRFVEALKSNVPAPKAALPVVTFNDTVTLHLNNEEIHAFHVSPAHTDGDSIIHFRTSNVVHTGDLFFNGLFPFIDGKSGGSVDGMVAAADRLLTIVDDNTKIIPGHGSLANRKQLIEYREMLSTVRDRMKSMIAAGKTLKEILEAKPTKEFDEKWGKGFMSPERFVENNYKVMTGR